MAGGEDGRGKKTMADSEPGSGERPESRREVKMEVRYSDGALRVQTDALVCEWSEQVFADGAQNFVVTRLRDRRREDDLPLRQVDGVWMAHGVGRGATTACSIGEEERHAVTAEPIRRVQMAWEGSAKRGPVIEEVTFYERRPVLRLSYAAYGVNVVDLLGAADGEVGRYVVHGVKEWRRRRASITDPAFRSHENPHHRLTDDLFPAYPNPLFQQDWGGTELSYRGWIVCGIVFPEAGYGFGRLMPVAAIWSLKLLFNRGFEFFPYYGEEHTPYVGYIFLGDPNETSLLETGRAIADEEPLEA